jgi:hypothetical protein
VNESQFWGMFIQISIVLIVPFVVLIHAVRYGDLSPELVDSLGQIVRGMIGGMLLVLLGVVIFGSLRIGLEEWREHRGERDG